MDFIRDLLVIVDPTAADQPAVEKAGVLAAALRANVEILGCDITQGEAVRLRGWLESLAAPLRAAGIPVRTSAIGGNSSYESLIRWIRNAPADLVLKDTHHHSLARRALLGSTDAHLIRDCPAPLLLVKATRWRTPPSLAAAVDPDHAADPQALLDQRILECTGLLARALKAETHVVYAYVPVLMAAAADYGAPSMLAASPELAAAEKSQHMERIRALLAKNPIADARVHVDMGIPSQVLPAIAEEYRIDILVMGALSRSHLKQSILGGTAERILERLPCDVLALKPLNLAESLPF